MIQVTPIILCGGSGTRLWPLSRTGFPKQFLCLAGDESLFQQAAQRLVNLGGQNIQVAPPIIVTGEDHRFLAAEQLREVGIRLGSAILEPVGKNTAPALTLAAFAAIESGDDPVLVVTPADQTVVDAAAFTAATQMAVEYAAKGSIVILGVTPDRPETGYGYIQVESGDVTAHAQGDGVHPVKRFVEKPNLSTAEQYLSEGGYFWNAGMFVLKASVWLKALEQFRPDIHTATLEAWAQRSADANTASHFVRPSEAEFTTIPAESVDYAVIERCPGSAFRIQMVPLNAGWNDLGAWEAIWNFLPKDENANAHLGDVLSTHSNNTLVHASIRLLGFEKKTKFYQASTSELFGDVREVPQTEKTPFYPRSPYAVAKLYAYWIVVNYREAYGIYACNGILFNHESPRRGETFVTRKITRGIANIACGIEKCLFMGNINSLRDWGHAKDYVRMQWLMLQQDKPDDFVIAMGKQYSVRDFIKWSAYELGINIDFRGDGVDEVGYIRGFDEKKCRSNYDHLKKNQIVVRIDPKYFRPTEVETLLGNAEKAEKLLGWKPEISTRDLCIEMINSDFDKAKLSLKF